MGIVNESMLRAALLNKSVREYRVPPGTFVTPLAQEYLHDRGIELIYGTADRGMPYTPITDQGEKTYIDAQSGRGYSTKPERMTHLSGNLLVPKTHPRIALRGKLDTLQGEIILIQTEACGEGRGQLVQDLGELLQWARELLGAEVSGRPLPPLQLLGYDAEALRRVSHQVQEHFGFAHPQPKHSLGKLAARLNLLRAQTREVELAAEQAFSPGEREDILLALNRLSSAVYIMFCRLLAGQYER